MSQVEKFVGCILKVRTKPSLLGEVQNIVGTVRKIDVDNQQAIVLDDAMANGKILSDGFMLMSTDIADLQVIGMSDDFKHTDSDSSDDRNEQAPPPSTISSGNVLLNSLNTTKIAKPKPRKVQPPEKENDILAKTFGDTNILKQFSNISNNKETKANPTKKVTKTRNQNDKDTFGMSSLEMSEFSKEFDFDKSNAMFCKLPVQPVQKPPRPLPSFSSHDTTHSQDRIVPSVGVKNSAKNYVTDTGVVVPSIDLKTRSMILNLATDVGLSHTRMIESMARGVVQTCLSSLLLGDTYRLSPEREQDRPFCLILAGPHWQGAVGIAVGRILATLGVRTFVHSPKEELAVCAGEERLYKLTGQPCSRSRLDITRSKFDLVVMALDDHVTKLSTPDYDQWLTTATVYVDPPVTTNFSQHGKLVVVSPCLPLAYKFGNSVKMFVVNLGIPEGVFLKNGVKWKSFFGDKLVVRVFSK